MKLFLVALLTGLATQVSAMGYTGALERIVFYSAYIMEEIHPGDTSDERKVAPDCVGTREGLRKQKNRCTLKEFCEHLWMATEQNGQPIDTRPDTTQTVWRDNGIDPSKPPKKALTPNSMANAIMSVTLKTGPLPKMGYYGFTDVSKILNGATDYFVTARNFGETLQRIKGQIDALPNSGDDGKVKKKVDKWFKHASAALDEVVTNRATERLKFEFDNVVDKLKNDPDLSSRRDNIQVFKNADGTVDKDKTAEKLHSLFPDTSEDAFKTKITNIINTGHATEEYIKHLDSENSWKNTKNVVDSCTG